MPTLEQVTEFVEEMWRFPRAYFDGVAIASDEKKNERIEICKGCDSFDSEHSKCRECGCFVKLKALLEYTRCPRNSW